MFDISPSSRDHLPVPDAQTSRLLPTTIDKIASQNPNRIFAEYIYSATTPGALYKIDYLTLARAIDRTAWWLKDVLDPLRLPKFAVLRTSAILTFGTISFWWQLLNMGLLYVCMVLVI